MQGYQNKENIFLPSTISTLKLDPGCYKVKSNMDSLLYIKQDLTVDEIIDLPSPEYQQITKEMDFFLKPETRESFKKYGFVYKRSTLLHGVPGTGKTVVVNRVANSVISEGGICLFISQAGHVTPALDSVRASNPEATILVILEEFEDMANDRSNEILSVLDGELQIDNVIYMATTNYLEKVPLRLRRPGRMSSVIQMKLPNAECRKFYFDHKLPGEDNSELVEKTDGYTVDELKEIVLATKCFGMTLDKVLYKIKQSKADGKVDPPSERGFLGDLSDQEELIASLITKSRRHRR